jgi:hypothetical protein
MSFLNVFEKLGKMYLDRLYSLLLRSLGIHLVDFTGLSNLKFKVVSDTKN